MLERLLPLLLEVRKIQRENPQNHKTISKLWRVIHDIMMEAPVDEMDILAELSHEAILGCSETAYAAWCVSLPSLLRRASIGEFSFIVSMLPTALHDRPIEDLDLGPDKTELLKRNNIKTIGDLIDQAKKSGALPPDSHSVAAEGLAKIGLSDTIH